METRAILLLAVLLATTGRSDAQHEFDEQLLQSPMGQPDYSFGQTFALFDVDRDGFDDLVACESNADVQGVHRAGRAWILFGPDLADSALLAPKEPTENENLGGGIVNDIPGPPSFGDVDGDGYTDVVIGAPSYDIGELPSVGRVHLFYGPDYGRRVVLEDPAPQYGNQLGYSVLLLDVTGDGRDDVIAGARQGGTIPSTGEALTGKVLIWDATELGRPTRVLEARDVGQLEGAGFGDSARRGDVDGDGRDELLIGAPFLSVGNGSGHVFVYDAPGPSFEQLVAPPIPPPGEVTFDKVFGFGDVFYVGDLSGDSVPDLLASAPITVHGSLGDYTQGFVVRADGPAFDYTSGIPPPDLQGQMDFADSCAVADFDQDGHVDVLAGDRYWDGWSSGQAWIFWGPEFEDHQGLNDLEFTLALYGLFVSAGDSDGDGWPEAYVNYPATDGNGKGFVFRYELVTLKVSTETLARGGSVRLDVQFGPSRGGRPFALFPTLCGQLPGGGGPPSVGMDALAEAYGSGGLLDPEGRASVEFSLPDEAWPSLAGQGVTIGAWVSEETGGVRSSSNTVAVEIAP